MTLTSPPAARAGAASAVLKILISGGFGVGKTTAVGSISEIEPLSTEEVLTEAGAAIDSLAGVEAKSTTTVAFDFGRITFTPPDVPRPVELLLFGTPGQDRFADLWYDLARGTVGAVVLADTRRLEDSFPAVGFFEHYGLPFILAVNPWDGAFRYHPEDVRRALDLDQHVPIVICDARNPDMVAGALITLIDHVVDLAISPSAHPTATALLDA